MLSWDEYHAEEQQTTLPPILQPEPENLASKRPTAAEQTTAPSPKVKGNVPSAKSSPSIEDEAFLEKKFSKKAEVQTRTPLAAQIETLAQQTDKLEQQHTTVSASKQ